MTENNLNSDYQADGIETGEEISRREYIDDLVSQVHENHTWPPGTDAPVERQRLLKHYIQIPEDPWYGDIQARARPAGEILVTFYNYILRRRCEKDDVSSKHTKTHYRNTDVDDSEDEGDQEAGEGVKEGKTRPSETHVASPTSEDDEDEEEEEEEEEGGDDERVNENSSCNPVPLQYLYDIPKDGKPPQMVESTELLSHIPSKVEGGGNLQIIEFPTPYYADDFLKSMKNVSLSQLVDDPKAAMVKVKSNKNSTFLRGVTYYPNVPPKQYVSRDHPRLCYRPGTFLFVAIPYIGQETSSSALFRKNPRSPPSNNFMKDDVVKRLTAYQHVDGDAREGPSPNSSLNLLEYKFPLQSETPEFGTWQGVLENITGGYLTVVHQAWFIVFDDETIAAFRSADDQFRNLPLFPQHRETLGAYHGLINMIGNLLPLSETKVPEKFQQRVDDLEFQAQTRNMKGTTGVGSGDELVLRMQTTKFELSAMINVVDAQIMILHRLAQFQLDGKKEQFLNVRKTVRVTISERKVFRRSIELVLQKLEDSQLKLTECLSKETAKEQAKSISEQLTIVMEVAEASKVAAEASNKAAEASTVAAEQSVKASEQIKTVSQESNRQVEDQGTKLTIFTFITTMFTPMNFLTSYWGMNFADITSTKWKQSQFWELCIPFTVFILLLVWVWAWAFRNTSRETKIRWPFTKRANPLSTDLEHGLDMDQQSALTTDIKSPTKSVFSEGALSFGFWKWESAKDRVFVGA